MPRILIIEDDLKIIEAIEKSFSLETAYTFKAVSEPDLALPNALSYKPDLILLDIRLPNADGRQILKIFKAHAGTKSIPVIFLTGMSSEGDRVLGLNLGADDYITKPFGAMELIARIQAVLRRTQPQPIERPVGKTHGLLVDPENRSVSYRGNRIKLQPREFDVLSLLVSHPGRTLSRTFLVENTSNYGAEVSTRSLDTHIKNIRKKLGTAGKWIETIPKSGYCFQPPHE